MVVKGEPPVSSVLPHSSNYEQQEETQKTDLGDCCKRFLTSAPGVVRGEMKSSCCCAKSSSPMSEQRL